MCSLLCTLHHFLQASYFRQTYPDKGVPEEVLTQLLSEAVEDEKATSVGCACREDINWQ